MPRRRILVLNQYYAPAFGSTAQLLTQLCEDLASDYDVTVITGAVEGAARGRLIDKAVDPERIVVIPNWVDPGELVPTPKDNPWSRRHGLHDKFVVMHSGNVGFAQNLDVLVRAATSIRDLDDVRLVVIGG